MFANSYQSGFVSIFYSVGSNPLALWDKQVKNGHIRRVVDDDVKSLVLEIAGTNVATTYITCPIQSRASLGVQLPFLVMVIKNMKRYFTFEIQILDDKDMRRRFRVSNFQSATKVLPFCTTMPIGLGDGWNQVQFNLADFTKRAYGSTYMETTRVQIHANVRIRRIYFSDRLYSDEDMPNEFKLFASMNKQKVAQEKRRESVPKAKESVIVEEQQIVRKSVDKVMAEPPPPSTPQGEEETRPPPEDDIAAPSPVGTDAQTEVEITTGEVVSEVTEEPPTEKEAKEIEMVGEGEETPSPLPKEEPEVAEPGADIPQEGSVAGEGTTSPEGAPTETTVQSPTETTEEGDTATTTATTEPNVIVNEEEGTTEELATTEPTTEPEEPPETPIESPTEEGN